MSGIQASLEGLRRSEASIEKIAKRLAELPVTVTGEPQDIVDISAEAIALMVAENTFQANLKALESSNDLAQSTLNLLA
jgi:hypothetical protein